MLTKLHVRDAAARRNSILSGRRTGSTLAMSRPIAAMRSLLILAVVALMPAGLAAQETTTDGVLALIAGDNQQAERILRPLADKADGNPVAQFFLGTMYKSGHGVPGNALSACGWSRRAAKSSGPFAEQAQRILSATEVLAAALPPPVLLDGRLVHRSKGPLDD